MNRKQLHRQNDKERNFGMMNEFDATMYKMKIVKITSKIHLFVPFSNETL